VSTQLDIFEQADVEVTKPERTEVRLGSRKARVNLAKQRRETLEKLMELLAQLEGKDVYIGADGGNWSHYSVDKLKLGRMRIQVFQCFDEKVPGVIALWGNRSGVVRIFTDQVVSLRCQEYLGYTLWLLDFWNGFGEYPIDRYRKPGCQSLCITRFKD